MLRIFDLLPFPITGFKTNIEGDSEREGLMLLLWLKVIKKLVLPKARVKSFDVPLFFFFFWPLSLSLSCVVIVWLHDIKSSATGKLYYLFPSFLCR